jgi:hypothetical protein
MTTPILLASTFTGIAMFVMGFWLARMIYVPQIHTARETSVDEHMANLRRAVSRTDAERAAGMVS